MEKEYMEMLEIPVSTCDVIIKPKKRKKKDIKDQVIDMVNSENSNPTIEPTMQDSPEKEIALPAVRRKIPRFTSFHFKKDKSTKPKKAKITRVENVSTKSVEVKSSRFDIISVQVVAIFVLIVGIILTNIFWEDSGMNNLLRSVFKSEESSLNSSVYSTFSAYSPTRDGEVILEDGVMTVNESSIYAPCDGVIEKVTLTEDNYYTVTVRHSDSFTSVFSGLDYSYLTEGESVYTNIPIGYCSASSSISLYENDSLLTKYAIEGDNIVWLN